MVGVGFFFCWRPPGGTERGRHTEWFDVEYHRLIVNEPGSLKSDETRRGVCF